MPEGRLSHIPLPDAADFGPATSVRRGRRRPGVLYVSARNSADIVAHASACRCGLQPAVSRHSGATHNGRAVRYWERHWTESMRLAILRLFVFFGVAVTVVTEGFGTLHLLRRGPL